MSECNFSPQEQSPYADLWALDPTVAMLNHGSFGACPREVMRAQQELRTQMESEPVRFMVHEMPPLLDESRRTLAELIGADHSDMVFVRNATSAVNSVLRSLSFEPGDELLVTDHDYNACRNAVRYVAQRLGASVVVASVPMPIESPQQVTDAVLAKVTARTKLAVLDHITSPTALIFPIEELVRELDGRGIDTLVDGAHAPGMVPLNLGRMSPAYYTGNCHKGLCAPKGAAFLYVRSDRQSGIHPTTISHGFNQSRHDRTQLHDEFDWAGTDDPTPWLCVGRSIEFLRSLTGHIEEMARRNHRLAIEGGRIICDRLRISTPCPESMIGSMIALPLPDDLEDPELKMPSSFATIHPLQAALLERFGVEVPLYNWPKQPRRYVRISAHLYNSRAQYERLADALAMLLTT